MVRIGNGKPRVYFADDRWGRITPFLTTNGYGYIDEELWKNLCIFQTAVEMTVDDREEFEQLRLSVPADQLAGMLPQTKLGRRVQAGMMVSGRPQTLWEFNAQAEPGVEAWVRFTAPLGEQYIVEWTDRDVLLHHAQVLFTKAYNAVRRRWPGAGIDPMGGA